MAESTTTPTQKIAEPEQKQPFDWLGFLQKFGVFLFLILLILFFAAQNPRFLSVRNVFNILTDVSIYGIMAVGMTLVILTAGVDLSVGAILAFCAMCGAAAVKGTGDTRSDPPDPHRFGGLSWLVALLICVALGTLVGFIQGKVSTRFRIPPFIVTLGGMTVWRGATLLIGAGSPVSNFDAGYTWWGNGALLGVPVPVLVFLVVAVLGYIALRYTPYGRHVYAVGGNPEAARLTGLRVDRVLTSVYVLMGLLAGVAGFIESARLSSAEATAGLGFELTVIASVVIGGTSLMGGIGGIAGTVVGTLLIGVLLNGLVIMNVNPYYQQIIIGVIIVLAVGFDTYAKSRRGRR
ncbi:MAG: ABC transporter permease [Verrucomicrobia bacterium]|nr:ABC transporter permease [Verrucomicrobiota bacterium]